MGYIKVAYQKLLSDIDSKNNSNIPNKWNIFIKKIAQEKHNLIIKGTNNQCICTNCKCNFISNKKINTSTRCPKCKNRYIIKRFNLKNYTFLDNAILLDKIDSQLVIRMFQIRSDYYHQTFDYSFKTSCVEYARILPFKNSAVFINERVSKNIGPMYIYHYPNPGRWRLFTRYYGISTQGYVYPNNLKKLLKDTEFRYSMIWLLVKKLKFCNIQEILTLALDSNKLEMLVKAKLFNLAIESYKLDYHGSFKSIFGVSKSFYPFMKKYNITYTQLKILQLIKEPDIKKIRYLEKYNLDSLEKINEYMQLNRFINYSKLHHGKIDIFIYKDYLKIAEELAYDLNCSKYLFPNNLKEEHDKLVKQYKLYNTAKLNKSISKRYTSLSKNIFKDKSFIIIPAPTIESLEDESKQQHNCVRTYAEDYALGKCDIYLMRNRISPDKSLVTVEVKNNKVVQSSIKYNLNPNEKQKKFLEIWEQKILKGVA